MEITENDIVNMLETTIQDKSGEENICFIVFFAMTQVDVLLGYRNLEKLDLDELDELEDSEDEAVLLEFRKKRIAELKELACKSKFGYVREITGEEYVNEVNHKRNV